MITTYRKPVHSNKFLVTIAIGAEHCAKWERYALPSWIAYAEANDLGILAVTDDLIAKSDPNWKKATWQKLLLGNAINRDHPEVGDVCFLDTDILINPFAPNVFDEYDSKSYGLVSQYKNLPMSRHLAQRQSVFLRHHFYDKNYPLDSSVFMTAEAQYEYSGLTPHDDLACAGMFLFNPALHGDEMEGWFVKYSSQTKSITGGDQVHLNWEMLSTNRVQWFPYEFQALWVFEAAWKYSFLFDDYAENHDVIRACIEASLFSNYFLHFAGSWLECDMWMIDDITRGARFRKVNSGFQEYLKKPVTGKPKGQIKPQR